MAFDAPGGAAWPQPGPSAPGGAAARPGPAPAATTTTTAAAGMVDGAHLGFRALGPAVPALTFGLRPMSEWQHLGKGGYGNVYRTTWMGVPVAVKEAWTPQCGGKPSAVAALRREIEILSTVRHPNIVQFFGAFSDAQGNLYSVMEPLHYSLRDRRIAREVDGAGRLADVARALTYLHGRGIMHRDIKARNVMLTEDCRTAKLIDFGLSASVHIDIEKNLKKKVGTRKYRAPEVSGRHVYGAGIDVYSLGVTIAKMLAEGFLDAQGAGDAAQAGSSAGPSAEAAGWLQVAKACTRLQPRQRPSAHALLKHFSRQGGGRFPPLELLGGLDGHNGDEASARARGLHEDVAMPDSGADGHGGLGSPAGPAARVDGGRPAGAAGERAGRRRDKGVRGAAGHCGRRGARPGVQLQAPRDRRGDRVRGRPAQGGGEGRRRGAARGGPPRQRGRAEAQEAPGQRRLGEGGAPQPVQLQAGPVQPRRRPQAARQPPVGVRARLPDGVGNGRTAGGLGGLGGKMDSWEGGRKGPAELDDEAPVC